MTSEFTPYRGSHTVRMIKIVNALDSLDQQEDIGNQIAQIYDDAAAEGSRVADAIPLTFSPHDWAPYGYLFFVIEPPAKEAISDFDTFEATPAATDPEHTI